MNEWQPVFDDGKMTDEQRLEVKLNQACEKITESLGGLLVELVNPKDAQRLNIMQTAVGQLFRNAAEDFNRENYQQDN